ncbi:RNA polymerase sigma factor [Spirillospora sp. CA-128828]|uniref:RNA polymerase sigma factor n=1 Tax=Spirillospora sp. CA-128828 TaxID=3240033 RepID=UPI003D93DFDE
MTEELTRAGADADGVPPQIYPDRHFTDDVSETTVALVHLETFYRRNKANLVFSVKSRNSITFEEAEDVVQEAFVRALRQVQTKPISNLDAWFKTVTRQIVADAHPKPTAHRKRRVRETSTDPAELPERRWDRAEGALPAEWLEMKEEARLVAEELSALPAKPRAVMAEYYDGARHEEIARLLSMSMAAVRQNLARGRKALRKRVESREKGAS